MYSAAAVQKISDDWWNYLQESRCLEIIVCCTFTGDVALGKAEMQQRTVHHQWLPDHLDALIPQVIVP